MDALRAVKNQFCGINPHLHSLWQAERGWEGFHTLHIAQLTTALRAKLLPIGYTAEIEESLQIRRTGEPSTEPESDVTIYDTRPDRATQPATLLSTDTHQLVLDLDEALVLPDADAAPFRAIAVYQVRQSNRIPVAWVELLSPSNKRGGRHADEYWYKRFDLLESGLVFVELDYLHESPPTFPQIASYRRQEPGAHPYRILVIDPRPDYRKGKIHVTQFDADAPIPTVTIPLSAGDKLDFNFNTPYQKTFEEMLYGLELVDYRELPIHFDRYTPEDQARILTRLLSVRANGVSDHAPVPLDPLIYADAAAQWALSD